MDVVEYLLLLLVFFVGILGGGSVFLYWRPTAGPRAKAIARRCANPSAGSQRWNRNTVALDPQNTTNAALFFWRFFWMPMLLVVGRRRFVFNIRAKHNLGARALGRRHLHGGRNLFRHWMTCFRPTRVLWFYTCGRSTRSHSSSLWPRRISTDAGPRAFMPRSRDDRKIGLTVKEYLA